MDIVCQSQQQAESGIKCWTEFKIDKLENGQNLKLEGKSDGKLGVRWQ